MIERTPTRNSGFTLIESVMAMAVAAVLGMTFLGLLNYVDSVDAAEFDLEARYADASRAMSELETAVQRADKIHKSGPGILLIEARYVSDYDDTSETVLFELVGDELHRTVNDPDLAKVETEVLLTGVAAFNSTSFELRDNFDATVYEDLVAPIPADELTNDTTDDAYFENLTEFAALDADLLTSWHSTDENLRMAAIAVGLPKVITVSPPLGADGLSANVLFIPTSAGETYDPIVYGDQTPDQNEVAVRFHSSGQVVLSVYDGGNLVEFVPGPTWTPAEKYRVGLRIIGDMAYAAVDNGSGRASVGKAWISSVNQKPLRLRSVSPGTPGVWDELRVDYPLVDLHLEFSVGNGTDDIHGGAAPR